MMWTYEGRDGVIRVGDEQEVLWMVDPSEAFAEYLDAEFSEIEVLDCTYSPSEVFREWSEDDFRMAAGRWFNKAILDPSEDDLSYFEAIDLYPATEEDIRDAEVDKGIGKIGRRSAGLQNALGKRGSGTARPKAGGGGMTIRPRAKPKTPVKKKASKPKTKSPARKPASKPKSKGAGR